MHASLVSLRRPDCTDRYHSVSTASGGWRSGSTAAALYLHTIQEVSISAFNGQLPCLLGHPNHRSLLVANAVVGVSAACSSKQQARRYGIAWAWARERTRSSSRTFCATWSSLLCFFSAHACPFSYNASVLRTHTQLAILVFCAMHHRDIIIIIIITVHETDWLFARS